MQVIDANVETCKKAVTSHQFDRVPFCAFYYKKQLFGLFHAGNDSELKNKLLEFAALQGPFALHNHAQPVGSVSVPRMCEVFEKAASPPVGDVPNGEKSGDTPPGKKLEKLDSKELVNALEEIKMKMEDEEEENPAAIKSPRKSESAKSTKSKRKSVGSEDGSSEQQIEKDKITSPDESSAPFVSENAKEISKDMEKVSMVKKKPFLGTKQGKKLPMDKAPKIARNLAQYMDLSKCMCLNDLAPTKFLPFIEGEKMISGVGTGQLNIVYQFSDVQRVTLHSMKIRAPPDNSPKILRFFVNQPKILDFSIISTLKPSYEITLTRKQLVGDEAVDLRSDVLRRINNFQLYIPCMTKSRQIHIDSIQFYGFASYSKYSNARVGSKISSSVSKQ